MPILERKKSPFEMDARRVTLEEVEEIRVAARKNQNQEMVAWAYLMQEVISIRKLLEQMIPNTVDPTIRDCGAFPQHSEADKKALADAIREILIEEAENLPPLGYT